MNKVYLAMLWHQHQPYYKDLVTGQMLMPWVRLHGIKDYIGMVDILDEFPALRQNFNLVPSLLDQLEDYVAGSCTDLYLDHALKSADDLEEAEVRFILDNFFTANWDTMIRTHQRYGELLAKRDFERRSLARAVKEFTRQDITDLQVWANLAWFHPLVIDRDELLREMIAKGRNYTEDEKRTILSKQIEVLARVIPRHKQLQDEGRAEISTTPYYHPILPLLCDMRSAHAALPRLSLPEAKKDMKDDARRQLEMAADYYREKFGREPRGLWPSEGSVSTDMLSLAVDAGFTWMATDEEILARSLNVQFSRDAGMRINRPDILYRPYQVWADSEPMNIIFRDHFLSDLIGFKYQWTPPERAANDFLTRLWQIRQRAPSGDRFVAVILDGENAWEHYKSSGVDFLRALYQRLSWWATTFQNIPRGQGWANYFQVRGSGTILPRGWATRRRTPDGNIYIIRGRSSRPLMARPATKRPLPLTRRPSAGRGRRYTLPRAATGSGGMEMTISRETTRLSTTSSGNT